MADAASSLITRRSPTRFCRFGPDVAPHNASGYNWSFPTLTRYPFLYQPKLEFRQLRASEGRFTGLKVTPETQ
jgi:hypothetical protein